MSDESRLTPERIDEFERMARAAQERADKATPGEWKLWGMSVCADHAAERGSLAGRVAETFFRDERGERRTFDAAFIACARDDVPALHGAVVELAAEVRRLRAHFAVVEKEQGHDGKIASKLKGLLKQAKAEHDELRADVERLRALDAEWQRVTGYSAPERFPGLTAEQREAGVERMRRWLQNLPPNIQKIRDDLKRIEAEERARKVASAAPDRVSALVKAMLDHADKLRFETDRGGLTDGWDDAWPNGYEQAAKDLARALGVEPAACLIAPRETPSVVARIRGLVMANAGEWADESDRERAIVRLDIMRILRLAMSHAKASGSVDPGYVEDLRSKAATWRAYADVSASAARAADDLERVRCAADVPIAGAEVDAGPATFAAAVLERQTDGELRPLATFEGADAEQQARAFAATMPGAAVRSATPGRPEVRNGELTCPCGDVLVESAWPWPPGWRCLYCCTCQSRYELGTLRELRWPNDPPRVQEAPR